MKSAKVSRRERANRATHGADTLIVGAGAAGLAAAAELGVHGHDVVVLEARERAGGRILTDTATLAPLAVELGAEFIHGASPSILSWLAASGDVAVDAATERWTAHGGRLRSGDPAGREFNRAFGRLHLRGRDMSFADFLDGQRRRLSPALRDQARRLVEGYDAADPARISAREVLREWSGPASADAPTFRPARGYGPLVDYLCRVVRERGVDLRYGTVVRAIRWSRGRVVVDARTAGGTLQLAAKRVIVTLPLGVLQLPASSPHGVRFDPEPAPKRHALARLAFGPALKVVMHFARPFWAERQGGRHRDAAFIFSPGAPFPTFWTSLPVRSPLLVAWCGGPQVGRLEGTGRGAIVAQVLASLRTAFGRARHASLLEHVDWHDWQADPYARGAYSYVTVNGAQARRRLAEPLDDTLYFAGEACDASGESATVGGALRSGTLAARRVLESLDRRTVTRRRTR